MNLFATYSDPVASARALDNARVNKMTTETAQIISTELIRRGYNAPFKPTHKGHPVVLWVQNDAALVWCARHHIALADEYEFRFGRVHASRERLRRIADRIAPQEVGRRPQFQNCARSLDLGIDFTHIRPTTIAYRMYLIERWRIARVAPRWTKCNPPSWAFRKVSS